MILKDKKKLDGFYIPEETPCREQERKRLMRLLESGKALISGEVGTGKTLLAKHTDGDVYVNCYTHKTEHKVLEEILRQTRPKFSTAGLTGQRLWRELQGDHLLILDEIDGMITELIHNGKLLKKSMKKDAKLPENFQKIKDYFSDNKIQSVLSGEGDLNEVGQKISKTISYKAPIAIKLANKIIDEGSQLELNEGLELELSHLSEIFSTQDALEGLNSVIKRQRPIFKGK